MNGFTGETCKNRDILLKELEINDMLTVTGKTEMTRQ